MQHSFVSSSVLHPPGRCVRSVGWSIQCPSRSPKSLRRVSRVWCLQHRALGAENLSIRNRNSYTFTEMTVCAPLSFSLWCRSDKNPDRISWFPKEQCKLHATETNIYMLDVLLLNCLGITACSISRGKVPALVTGSNWANWSVAMRSASTLWLGRWEVFLEYIWSNVRWLFTKTITIVGYMTCESI